MIIYWKEKDSIPNDGIVVHFVKVIAAFVSNIEPRDFRLRKDLVRRWILFEELLSNVKPVRHETVSARARVLDVAVKQINLKIEKKVISWLMA